MTDAKIIVPAEDNGGLNALVAEHFGRAPFFAVVTIVDGKVESAEFLGNKGEHFGGQGHMHDHILEQRPNAIITRGIGPRGLLGFQSAGIAVLKADADTVGEAIASYLGGKLRELSGGCLHARHHC